MTDCVIIIAYHFPPENSVGGLRPFRFFKYLRRQGFECHVITAAPVSKDPEVAALTTSIPDPFTAGRHNLGWHTERAIRRFLIPGVVGTHWSRLAYRAAASLIRERRNQAITVFSTWPPLGTHLAGWRLKRRFGVRWIADYRDPLAGRQAHGYGDVAERCFQYLERTFMRRADVAIANTDSAEQVWRTKYPEFASKFHLIWNGFDPETRIAPLPIPDRPFRIFSHVGELYEGRTMAPILESFSRLVQAGRIDPTKVQIHQVGPAAAACLPDPSFLNAAQEQGWLKLVSQQVPKPDAVRLTQIADGLLIVQPQSALQVPAKLFEYVQIGRPLLAFVPPDSPVERILKGSGLPFRAIHTGARPEQFDSILLEFFSLPNEPVPASTWFENTFNAEAQTRFLASLIRDPARQAK